MQQQHAWKSVYTSGPTPQRQRQAPRTATPPENGLNRPQSKNKQHAAHPYLPCTAAAAAGTQQCSDPDGEEQCNLRETVAAESSRLSSKPQHSGDSRPSTSRKLKTSNLTAAPVATAQHAQAALCRPLISHHQQVQQQKPADTQSRTAANVAAASTASNAHPASTRRLSSPPAQAVPRTAQQQALSPYLAALPVTARRPRSPGGPRPASPLSGLSRAARNATPSTLSTILAAASAEGSTSCSLQQGSRAGLQSAAGRKRPHQQQRRRSLAAFHIQVSYGPQLGGAAQEKAAAATPLTAAAAQQADCAQLHGQAMSAGLDLDSCPVPAHSSSIAGVAAPHSAHAAGGAAAAGDDADVPAGYADPAGESIADEAAFSTVAGSCEAGGSCSEGTEQGLGMMLSEYILQMHTTPVACNSVSGLGDDSDSEEDYEPAQHSSRHGLSTYSGQGSILASWGLMGPASAAAPQSICGDDDVDEEPALEADGTSISAPTGCNEAVITEAAAAAGSPFAAAGAWQPVSRAGTCDKQPPCTAFGCRPGSAGSSCSSECMLEEHEVAAAAAAAASAAEFGFPPSDCDCELYRDIMGDDSSSCCSLDLDQEFHDMMKNSSSTAATAQAQHSPAATGAKAMVTATPGPMPANEGVAGSSLRPQSSAGRRGQASSSSTSPSKDLVAGRRPSGFLMASANSLDLRPATAMASVRSSSTGGSGIRTAADAQAALHRGNSSGRPLSSCQQQRSFTDLDSSVEGFVKEVSLGHLSASLFTPSAASTSARVPLQKLWGSFEVGSTQSSFSSKDAAGTQQHQQHRQQAAAAAGEGWSAAAAEPPAQQLPGSSALKQVSPTRASQGAASGFLQRLTQSTQHRDAEGQLGVQPAATGGWCGSEDAARVTAQQRQGPEHRVVAGASGDTHQRQHAAALTPDAAAAAATSICSAALSSACMCRQPQAAAAVDAPSPIVAWGAPPAAAERPSSRRTAASSSSSSSPNKQLDPAKREQLQQHAAWAVHVPHSKRAPNAGNGATSLVTCRAAAAAGGAKPNTASDTLSHACQHEDVRSHGPDASVGGGGRSVQQPLRPPSRQRPPAESLHLFNSFAALS